MEMKWLKGVKSGKKLEWLHVEVGGECGSLIEKEYNCRSKSVVMVKIGFKALGFNTV